MASSADRTPSSYFTHECGASWSLPGDIPEAKCPNCDVLVLRRPRREQAAAQGRPQAAPPSDEVRRTFEFADRVYICDYCGSMQPSGDKDCPDCGRDLFTWAGFLGRSDRFRVGSGDLVSTDEICH